MPNEDRIAVYEILDRAASGIRLQVEFQRRVNAALIASRLPFIRAIAVHNETGGALPGFDLTVELTVGSDSARKLDYRHGQTVMAGEVIRFGGEGYFTELVPLIDGCRELTVATLTLAVRPLQTETDAQEKNEKKEEAQEAQEGQGGDKESWPSLSAAVEISAVNEFLNLPGLRHSLAAFVQPNSRSVTRILRGASDFLLKKTGSGSLEGYQSGFSRAKLIAGAIYQAMRDERISYINPPASFEATGQKVRTTQEVLSERFGTCIDLSVTYAACCEAAGLYPIIVITATHAFPAFVAVSELEYALALGGEKGFEFLGEMVVDNPNVIANLIETKTLIPVELCGVGPGKQSLSFRAAAKKAGDYVRSLFHELKSAVVIPQCRRARVLPLPGFLSGEDAASVEDKAVLRAERPFIAWTSLQSITLEEEKKEQIVGVLEIVDDAPPRVRQWKQSLFDLSLRNPLLNMPQSGRVIDLIVPGGMLSEIDDAIHGGKTLHCVSSGDPGLRTIGSRQAGEIAPEYAKNKFAVGRTLFSTLDDGQHHVRLRALKREAETLKQETGSNYLYLALGVLIHTRPDGKEARAPLFLLPVKLSGGLGGGHYSIALDGDEIAQPNLCLLEWLRVTQGQTLDALANPDLDASGIAINTVFTKIRASLLEAGLPYRIDESATLAILKFSTFQIWKDLDRNWPIFLENPVVRHLVERPGETFEQAALLTAPPDEEKLILPIAADGSQMAAIEAAADGKSFVLEGPPGTGKSQTIVNLIAHALDMGKRVLFVAEKEAALEVVIRRLEAIGLKDFALEAHGSKLSMHDIRQQLKRSLRALADDNEMAWKTAFSRYTGALAALKDYPERLHAPNAAGFSLWTAYDARSRLGDGPDWEPDPRLLGSLDAQAMEGALTQAVHILRQIGPLKHDPWLLAGHEDVENLTFTTLTQALEELAAVRKRVESFAWRWTEAFDELRPGRYLTALNECIAANRTGSLPGKAYFRDIDRSGWRDTVMALRQKLATFIDANRAGLETFAPGLIDSPKLNDWIVGATHLINALFFAEFRRKPIRVAVEPLVARNTELGGSNLLAVLQSAQNIRSQSSELKTQALALPGLILPANWAAHRPRALEEFDTAVRLSQLAVWLEQHAPAAWLKVQEPRDAREIDALKDLEMVWMRWLVLIGATERNIERWLGGRGWFAAWDEDAPRWSDELSSTGLLQLQRHAWLDKELQTLEQTGALDLANKLVHKAFPLEDAITVMQRGLAAASLRERLAASGLGNFDDIAQERAIFIFQENARELRRLAVSGGPARLLARRPFRSDNVHGEVAALIRQIERKRGGMSLREISARYPEALLTLVPVFLMSPGSVAHLLNAGSLKFDLVIFDEASQIRVPEAIGAMGRGRSVVIVGDSKQMPPSTMMEASTAQAGSAIVGEDGEPVVEDLESILSEAVDSGLPQLRLNWHYRSENEELIAFSNARYYDGELVTLPPARSDAGTGIVWRRVDGEFSRGRSRTNSREARAVVDEITARLRDPARQRESIGVVCFNLQQRDLILNMLEESSDLLMQEALTLPGDQRLFVKNLENVQGDERDIILFSMAFSPDPATGILPLNFGPLNNTGGERRLNVAITRARKQVVLFSSFDPNHIDLARTNAAGLRDLKHYLEFAAAAAAGNVNTPQARKAADARSAFSTEIASALEARGYTVQADIGRSSFRVDLAVKKTGDEGWRMAIMLDSPAWKSRLTVTDRDAAPTLLRDIMKWPAVARVWLPGWLRDREGTLTRLIERIESPYSSETFEAPDDDNGAASESASSVASAASKPAAPSADEALPDDAPIRSADKNDLAVADFVPAPDSAVAPQSALSDMKKARPEVVRLATEALAAEGPVHLDRLTRIVSHRFGYSRLGSQKRAELSRFLSDSFNIDEDHFVWPGGVDRASWRAVRRTVSPLDRSLPEISPVEVLNAMEQVLIQALSASQNELIRSTAVLLGHARLTENAQNSLLRVLVRGLTQGRFIESDGRLRVR